RSEASRRSDDLGTALARIATALALRIHIGFEAGFVDGHAVAAQDVLRHVEREAVGVVELESDGARKDLRTAAFEALALGFEERKAVVEGFGEAFFLALNDLLDVRLS